jgi:hypothetical protein
MHPCGGEHERPCTPTPNPPDCGEWKSKKSITSSPFMELHVRDRHWCWKKCTSLPGCEGVTWKSKEAKNCLLHKLGSEDVLTSADKHAEAFVLCNDCGSWEPSTTVSGTDLKTKKVDRKWCGSMAVMQSSV